ncbi:hypothetical protein CH373_02165 [Leptospira perolatii]|uniref:Uncharacterized protein n=2 Tax=Leptospira perolatii TaxID=2023191 RepID=A0A2M9ZT19_9LEPT|nr:hypothetical protein CH360_02165 [Leptospira perolatii]PJZ75206.1 hypothetical protein CH373_02165 [Leptospira perolatii]
MDHSPILRSYSATWGCIFIVFLILFSYGCKQSPKESALEILQKQSIPEPERIREAAEALFGERLKDMEVVPGSDSSKYEIYLAFGGTSALTFLESDQYAARMRLELALQTFRFLQVLEGYPIGKFRMSLVKPYFVKNSEEDRGVEEFEVFRFRADGEQLRALPGFKDVDAFSADRYDAPKPEVINVLFKIVQNWQVELDLFPRVQVK